MKIFNINNFIKTGDDLIMKKKIIVGLLMISALSFGAAKNNPGNMQNNQMMNPGNMMGGQMGMMNQMNNLTETQQKELMKLMQERRDENYKQGLDMRSKQLEMEKLLSKDTVNWQSVQRVNKQISDMQAKQRLDNMKFAKDVKNKYGISMGMNGMMMQMHNQMMNNN